MNELFENIKKRYSIKLNIDKMYAMVNTEIAMECLCEELAEREKPTTKYTHKLHTHSRMERAYNIPQEHVIIDAEFIDRYKKMESILKKINYTCNFSNIGTGYTGVDVLNWWEGSMFQIKKEVKDLLNETH